MTEVNRKKPWGTFCDIFGSSARNRVVEIFLEGPKVDNGLGNIAEESGLSRAAVYNTIAELLGNGFVIPSRRIGRTQLYKLDLSKEEVKVLIRAFDLGLKVVEKEAEKELKKDAEKAVIG